MSIGDRLRYAVGIKFKSIKEFSEKTGIAYRTIQGYLAGTREPEAEQLAKIYAQANINIGWLLTGEGSIFRENSKPPILINDIPKEKVKEWLDEFWQHSNQEDKYWLLGQIKRTFPEYQEWLQKNEGGNQERNAG